MTDPITLRLRGNYEVNLLYPSVTKFDVLVYHKQEVVMDSDWLLVYTSGQLMPTEQNHQSHNAQFQKCEVLSSTASRERVECLCDGVCSVIILISGKVVSVVTLCEVLLTASLPGA